MNYGPIVFLAAFFAMAGSWFTFVLKPQLQVGQMRPTNTIPAGVTYPVARSGLAQQGLQVYRANGCYYCHSQQVVQEGTVFEVILREPGTNPPALKSALEHLVPELAKGGQALEGLPKPIMRGLTKDRAESAVKLLNASGAQAAPWVVPVGADMARGWGRRRSVAEDFLYDSPAMPGSQRVGPDLANIGVRQPDIQWHLRHLYAPGSVVKGSVMPPYRFLFERRKAGSRPSPNALSGTRELGVEDGYEIVPKPEALALAAYMTSLKSDAPLYSAPFSIASAPTAPAGGAQTNAAPSAGAAQPNVPANASGPTNAPKQ